MPQKTKYTNADLPREIPAREEVGPWKTVSGPQRPAIRSLLDEMIAEGATPESVVAGAKRRLSKPAVGDLAALEAVARGRAGTIRPRTYTDKLRDIVYGPAAQAAETAALPAMFTPAAPIAAGIYGAGAIRDFIAQPSLGSAAGTVLSAAAPVAGAYRQAAMREAGRGGQKVAEGLYRQTGLRRGRELPYRMTEPVSSTRPRSAMRSLVDEYGDTPVSVVDDIMTPQARPTPEEAMEVINMNRRGAAAVPTRRPVRPSPDYIHPADTSGAMFGFEDLPEISEAELSRLQALFNRLGL